MTKNLLFKSILIIVSLSIGLASAIDILNSVIESDISPGGHFSQEITMKLGDKEAPMNFSVQIMGISKTPDGSNVELTSDQDNGPYTARPFLTVTPTSFDIASGASQKLLVEGDVPANIGSGGRYALVNIKSEPVSTKNGKANLSIITAFDIPIRLTLKGTNLVETGEISDLKVEEPISGKVQNVSVTLKNTGNYHYFAQAKADLKDKNGDILANSSTPLGTTAPIIPTTSRLFKLTLKPTSELKPGFYSVNSTVNLEDGTVLATKETSFEIKS